MSRIAILAALPSELKPLVRSWRRVPAPPHVSMWTHRDRDGDELVAACAGMGPNAIRRAFGAAEITGPLDLIVNVGLAGATGNALRVGEVSCLTEIVDAQTGERFSLTDGGRSLRICTVQHTANTAEKARLLSSYGAVLVDMEAATVARLAAMRNLPISCIKVVSDAADATLPEIDRFVDTNGQLQILRFVAHLAIRPKQWGAVAALAKNSKAGSVALADKLREFLEHKDWAYTNRTGLFRKTAQD